MSRVTTRVDLHKSSPDQMVKLAAAVKDKHVADGPKSPLTEADMKLVSDLLAAAQAKRAEASSLIARAEALNGEAANLIGVAKGQTSKTPGTLYFQLCKIRDLLLPLNRGIENNLELWGFKVVIGQAAAPRKREAKPASLDS